MCAIFLTVLIIFRNLTDFWSWSEYVRMVCYNTQIVFVTSFPLCKVIHFGPTMQGVIPTISY